MAAIDFSPLQQIDPAGAFFRGQQAAQADAERNMLRQAQVEQMAMQRENMLAQRQERLAMAADREEQARSRRAAAVRQAEADEYLGKVSALFEQNNTPLNMATARQGLAFAIKSRDPNAIQMMTKTVQALEEKASYEAEAARLGLPGAAAPAAPANALAAPPAAAAAPAGVTREMTQQMILSTDPRIREQGKALLSAIPAPEKPLVVGGNLVSPGGQVLFTAPRQPQLLTPEEEEQKKRIARESRPPAQPKEPAAPTVTQIQDPTDPNRMITIDARRYAGGGIGSPGVIGSSGKTPKAESDRLKQEQGASQAQDILDTLKTAYSELDRMRAVPSEQRGALSNIVSGVAATGVGQATGRLFGTKEQTQRDIIASSRNQLLSAIKNATGMSAQQLNSNIELRVWLDALSDPSRSIQANQAILDNVERFIASGGKYSARKGEGGATPAAPTATKSGATVSNW